MLSPSSVALKYVSLFMYLNLHIAFGSFYLEVTKILNYKFQFDRHRFELQLDNGIRNDKTTVRK